MGTCALDYPVKPPGSRYRYRSASGGRLPQSWEWRVYSKGYPKTYRAGNTVYHRERIR